MTIKLSEQIIRDRARGQSYQRTQSHQNQAGFYWVTGKIPS